MQLFEGEALEESPARVGEVMLHRIAQREKTAACVFQSVSQCDQFLPAVDTDSPPVTQVAGEFLRVDVEIGDVGVAPDKWLERLDIGPYRTILFASVNFHGSRLTELDGDNPRGRVGPEQELVFLESHGQ